MYCSRCGTQNKDSAKFCDSCGLDLTATTPVGAIKEQQELTEIEMVRKELEKEYEVLDELGRGGMAIVFKAKETELDREVAIKVLPFSSRSTRNSSSGSSARPAPPPSSSTPTSSRSTGSVSRGGSSTS